MALEAVQGLADTVPEDVLRLHNIDPMLFDGGTLYEPHGCPKCSGVGYRGRGALMEILVVDDDIRDLIDRMHIHQFQDRLNGLARINLFFQHFHECFDRDLVPLVEDRIQFFEFVFGDPDIFQQCR